MNRRHLLHFIAASALVGCGRRKIAAQALPANAKVLALGDSLTFGYGASPGEDWPARLSALTDWRVVNEGVNGDTTAGAMARLGALLAGDRYDAILIGIGGNDMLRGVPAQTTRDNIAAIVREACAHTPNVALLATPAPELFRATIGALSDAPFYEEVASAEKALLIPAVYAGVLSDPALRSDRIHANAQGYDKVAQQIAAQLKAAGWR